MRISIDLGKEEEKILKKRAEKNYFSLIEQVEDILRRSCIRTKKGSSYRKTKIDDRLVAIFSKDPRGRKRKPKKKKVKR